MDPPVGMVIDPNDRLTDPMDQEDDQMDSLLMMLPASLNLSQGPSALVPPAPVPSAPVPPAPVPPAPYAPAPSQAPQAPWAS